MSHRPYQRPCARCRVGHVRFARAWELESALAAWWRRRLYEDSRRPSLRGYLEARRRIEIGIVDGRALYVGAGVGLRVVHHGDVEEKLVIFFFVLCFFFVVLFFHHIMPTFVNSGFC
jgi:hypothetical protein